MLRDFFSEVRIDQKPYGQGQSSSKTVAEKAAAKTALKTLNLASRLYQYLLYQYLKIRESRCAEYIFWLCIPKGLTRKNRYNSHQKLLLYLNLSHGRESCAE